MSELLTLEDRKLLKLNGVKEVMAFCDNEIKLLAGSGELIVIKGNALKISAFSKENGDFKLSGTVSEIRLKQKSSGLGRIFK